MEDKEGKGGRAGAQRTNVMSCKFEGGKASGLLVTRILAAMVTGARRRRPSVRPSGVGQESRTLTTTITRQQPQQQRFLLPTPHSSAEPLPLAISA